MNRIVITGASGFIGRKILPHLLNFGYEVFGISRRKLDLENLPQVKWLEGDLFDDLWRGEIFKTIQPSHLLHCAWYTEHGKFWNGAQNLDWLAVSVKLIKEFQECGGTRVLITGSCAEYDWNCREGELISETHSCFPSSLYGETKLALLRVLNQFSQQTGLSYAWARIFWVFGQGEPPQKLMSSLVNSLKKNEVFVCNSGELIRDFISAEEVARALVAILQSDVTGPINVGSGQPMKIADIVKFLGSELGKPELVKIHYLANNSAPRWNCAEINKLKYQVKYVPENIYDSLKKFVGE